MKKLNQYLVFPLSLAATIVGATWLMSFVHASMVPLTITVVAFVGVLALERVMPRVARPSEQKELRTDLTFVGLTALLSDPLANALVVALVIGLSSIIPAGLAASMWLPAATASVLVAGGFGDYWAHRLAHETGWWWKLHAVHHAPHRMVALNNLRLHPVDLILKTLFTSAPVLALGFSPEAIALAASVRGLNVAFQHADIDLRHGPLNLLFSTNSVHRWHHSAERSEADANYGGVLSIFDLLFGTFRVPSEEEEPGAMGLYDEQHYPIHKVARSLVAPLCWKRCVTADPAQD
ncbi:MAG: sterol desaturase family protein [Polyangiales bacterium]